MGRLLLLLIVGMNLAWSQNTGVEQVRRAEITEDTRQVVVSGIGIDRDSAIKQGLRTAVEQAIGVFLKSETVVENFQLISDKILSHSRGYVNSFEVIDEKAESGLYSVTLSAVVIVKQLEATLIELNLYSRPVEGENLFAKAATKIREARSAAALFADLRSDYPRNAIEVIFGEPDSRTDQYGNVYLLIPYSIAWNEAYLNQLVDVLEQTSHKIANNDRERGQSGGEFRLGEYAQIDLRGVRYYVPAASAKELFYRVRGDEYSMLILLDIHISLVDRNGDSIAANTFKGRTALLRRIHRDYLSFEYATSPPKQNHINQWSKNLGPAEIRVSLDQVDEIVSVTGYAVDPSTR